FVSFLPAPTQTSPLSLHDALPICLRAEHLRLFERQFSLLADDRRVQGVRGDVLRGEDDAVRRVELRREPLGRHVEPVAEDAGERSEEHTSELQSLAYLVCRLLLEK